MNIIFTAPTSMKHAVMRRCWQWTILPQKCTKWSSTLLSPVKRLEDKLILTELKLTSIMITGIDPINQTWVSGNRNLFFMLILSVQKLRFEEKSNKNIVLFFA